jgi:hypothetical protein
MATGAVAAPLSFGVAWAGAAERPAAMVNAIAVTATADDQRVTELIT